MTKKILIIVILVGALAGVKWVFFPEGKLNPSGPEVTKNKDQPNQENQESKSTAFLTDTQQAAGGDLQIQNAEKRNDLDTSEAPSSLSQKGKEYYALAKKKALEGGMDLEDFQGSIELLMNESPDSKIDPTDLADMLPVPARDPFLKMAEEMYHMNGFGPPDGYVPATH